MMNHVLITHLLGATIWTGGHLILALSILPKALVSKDIDTLMAFEQRFEKVGMPALVIQIITGLLMAHKILPNIADWFVFDNDISVLIGMKLSLLILTVVIALHARFKVIPNLSSKTLNVFAIHIALITILSVGFIIVGTLFRTGL